MTLRSRIARLELAALPRSDDACPVCRGRLIGVEFSEEYPNDWKPGENTGAAFPDRCPECERRMPKVYGAAVRAIWAFL